MIHAVCPLSLPDGVNAASSKLWCKTREGVFLNCGLIFGLDVTLTLMVMLRWLLKYNYLGVLTLKYYHRLRGRSLNRLLAQCDLRKTQFPPQTEIDKLDRHKMMGDMIWVGLQRFTAVGW